LGEMRVRHVRAACVIVLSRVSRCRSSRHRSTPPYGSDCWLRQPCTLLLHVRTDTYPDHDVWSPLGRRACMQFRCLHVTCARLRCARMLSCSVCVLFWSIYACLHAHAASFCPACVFASVHVSIFSMPMTYVVPRHSPQSYSPCPTRSCHTAHVQHACYVCTPMPVL